MKKYTAFLIPMHDLIVRDPVTKKIMLKTGEEKVMVGKDGRYWKRRISDGSVKILETKKIKQTIRQKHIKREND